eukprot:352507-Chlamydomonas_euryale.AAC.17
MPAAQAAVRSMVRIQFGIIDGQPQNIKEKTSVQKSEWVCTFAESGHGTRGVHTALYAALFSRHVSAAHEQLMIIRPREMWCFPLTATTITWWSIPPPAPSEVLKIAPKMVPGGLEKGGG